MNEENMDIDHNVSHEDTSIDDFVKEADNCGMFDYGEES